MGEEASHRVFVEVREVGRVELFVVRNQEFLGDRLPEATVEHVLEARLDGRLRGRVFAEQLTRSAREIEVHQAVDELFFGELVDVLLEGKIDATAAVRDVAQLLHRADVLTGHALAQERLDFGVLEVEKVTRVVPREAVLFDGLAVATDLVVRLEE